MKRVILTTAACLFLSVVGYAQGTSLESFFNHYSEEDGFTYVYTGKKDKHYDSYSQKPCSLKFSKVLSCDKVSNNFVESLKAILIKQNFELVKKIKSDSEISETYRIELDGKEFEEVRLVVTGLIVTGTKVHVRWVSGKVK